MAATVGPRYRLKVGSDRLGRLLLGPKVEIPAVDHGLELAGLEVARIVAADPLWVLSPDMQPP
jgi:hypothetical protein